MDLIPIENRPETCAALGLDCLTCMHRAAATVARICQELEPHGVQQIFLQLYPSVGCLPMAATFEMAYSEASAPANQLLATTAAAAAAA